MAQKNEPTVYDELLRALQDFTQNEAKQNVFRVETARIPPNKAYNIRTMGDRVTFLFSAGSSSSKVIITFDNRSFSDKPVPEITSSGVEVFNNAIFVTIRNDENTKLTLPVRSDYITIIPEGTANYVAVAIIFWTENMGVA